MPLDLGVALGDDALVVPGFERVENRPPDRHTVLLHHWQVSTGTGAGHKRVGSSRKPEEEHAEYATRRGRPGLPALRYDGRCRLSVPALLLFAQKQGRD